jgi:hypothetical protein
MVAAKPVALTQASSNPASNKGAPEPLQIIGKMPAGAFTETSLTAVPASFADLAAVKTYLDTLVGQLKGSPYFS